MELAQQMLQNGQEAQTGDITNMGLSAIMDDRVLADILRLGLNTAGTVSKAILPYGTPSDNSSTVAPTQSANGSVYIYPFRAVVGSTTLITGIGTPDALSAWRDVRSGVFAGGEGVWNQGTPSTLLASTQLITANSSGNARWDVIYAIITPNANQPAVARAVKSPTTGIVTTPNTVVQLATTVSLGYTTGTPSANPVLPAIPADSAGVYYVALAYIAVQNGFGAATQVQPFQIWPVANPGPSVLARGLGGGNLSVPNSNPTAANIAAWANNTTPSVSGRPQYFLTQEMRGKEELLVTIDLPGAVSSNWSHVSGALIDNTRNWSNRLWKVTAFVGVNGPPASIWAQGRATPTTKIIPAPQQTMGTPQANNTIVQVGQSFIQDATYAASSATICYFNSTQFAQLAAGTGGVALYVDNSGALRVYIGGTGNNTNLFLWVEASGPLGSY